MALSPAELENLADYLLRNDFENPKRDKSRTVEYPVLSPSQFKRRIGMEIPYSNLSQRQKLECQTRKLEYTSDVGG